ncbi:MAG: thiamine-phosphate kinase [bacterium]
MKIRELGEFAFINRVLAAAGRERTPVVLGIGDDASILAPEPGRELVVTTDMLMEGVHFLRESTPPEDLGYKSLVVNLSDVAAMGGKPIQAYLSLALTSETEVEVLDRFIQGFLEAAGDSVQLSGGDTVSSKAGWAISVTVIGDVKEGAALRRDAAAAGDIIYLSGPTGESAAGLAFLLDQFSLNDVTAEPLIRAHNRPVPELELGSILSESGLCACAIDISDGLLQDLHHICKASSVGARLFLDKIPLTDELIEAAKAANIDPYRWSLAGGEDYRLLFMIREKNVKILEEALKGLDLAIQPIGIIEKGESIQLFNRGRRVPVPEKGGYDHFRNE